MSKVCNAICALSGKLWYHANCGKVNNDVYRIISDTESIEWYCPRCKINYKENGGKLERSGRENMELPCIRVCPLKPISWLTFKIVESQMGEVGLQF